MEWSENTTTARTGSSGRHAVWVLLSLLLVAAVGIAAYANTFSVPFMFDGEQEIVRNNVTKDLSLMFTGQGFHFNPRRVVGYLTLALNYRLGGLDVTGYHAVNLAIHLASAFLVYALAAVTLRTPFFSADPASPPQPLPPASRLLPLFAALLFVAHPVQIQAVTYIVQRFASLATMFYLASVVCYSRGRAASAGKTGPASADGGGRLASGAWGGRIVILLWLVLAAFMAALAMLTKEIAATLPAAILLYECCFFGNARKKLVRVVTMAAALAGGAWLFLLVTHRAGDVLAAIDGMTRETTGITRGTYFLTQLTVIPLYLRLLVLPVKQMVLYTYPLHTSLFDLDVILSALLLGSLLALSGWCCFRSGQPAGEARPPVGGAVDGRRLLRIAGFGGLWFFLTLAIESSIIPIRDVIFEHRVYLPSAGFFLAAAAVAAAVPVTRRVGRYALAAVAVVVTLACVTWHRNGTWHDQVSLWSDNVAKAPSNKGAWQSLGVALQRKDEYYRAIQAYLHCLALDPSDPEIYNNLGAAYDSIGRFDKAGEMFTAALRLAPAYWATWLNLGRIDIKKRDYPAAEMAIKRAIGFAPQRIEGHYHLGFLYEIQGRNADAEREFRQAIALDPSYGIAWKGLGDVVRAQGRLQEALEYTNRGALLEQQGGDIYYGITPPGL